MLEQLDRLCVRLPSVTNLQQLQHFLSDYAARCVSVMHEKKNLPSCMPRVMSVSRSKTRAAACVRACRMCAPADVHTQACSLLVRTSSTCLNQLQHSSIAWRDSALIPAHQSMGRQQNPRIAGLSVSVHRNLSRVVAARVVVHARNCCRAFARWCRPLSRISHL